MNVKELIEDIISEKVYRTQRLQELYQQSYYNSGMNSVIHELIQKLQTNNKQEILQVLFILHSVFRNSFIEISLIDFNNLIKHLENINQFWNEYEDDKAFSLSIANYAQYLSLKTQLFSSLKFANDFSFLISLLPSVYIDQVQTINKVFTMFDSLISTIQTLFKFNGNIRIDIIPLVMTDGISLMKLCNWLVTRIYENNGDREFHVYCIERLKIVYYRFGLLFFHVTHLSTETFFRTNHQLEPFPRFVSDWQNDRNTPNVCNQSIIENSKREMRDWFDYHMLITNDQIRQIEQMNGVISLSSHLPSPFNTLEMITCHHHRSERSFFIGPSVIQTVEMKTSELELMKKSLDESEQRVMSLNQKMLTTKFILMLQEFLCILQNIKYQEERKKRRITKAKSEQNLHSSKDERRKSVEISRTASITEEFICKAINRCVDKFHQLVDMVIILSIDWNDISNSLKEININLHHIILYYNTDDLHYHHKQFVYFSKDLTTETYSDTLFVSHPSFSLPPTSKSLPSKLHQQFSFPSDRLNQ